MSSSRLVAVLQFCFTATLNAQAVVTGTVRSDSTGTPLASVDVLVEGTPLRGVSDLNGRYRIELAPGNHVLLFRRVGYRPIRQALRAASGDTVWVNPLLIPSAVELPPLEVNVEEKRPRGSGLEAFEERRKLRFGKFIDSGMLREMDNRKVGDVLARYTTVRLIRRADRVYAHSSRQVGPNHGNCWMQVIVDGMAVYKPEDQFPPRSLPPPDFSREYVVSEIEAMEVYASAAGTPAEFNSTSAACGTIVIWTRRGLKP